MFLTSSLTIHPKTCSQPRYFPSHFHLHKSNPQFKQLFLWNSFNTCPLLFISTYPIGTNCSTQTHPRLPELGGQSPKFFTKSIVPYPLLASSWSVPTFFRFLEGTHFLVISTFTYEAPATLISLPWPFSSWPAHSSVSAPWPLNTHQVRSLYSASIAHCTFPPSHLL